MTPSRPRIVEDFSIPPGLDYLNKVSVKTVDIAKKKASWHKTGNYEPASIWKLADGRFVVVFEGLGRNKVKMPEDATKVYVRKQGARWEKLGEEEKL